MTLLEYRLRKVQKLNNMPNIHKNLKEIAFEEHIERELVRMHGFRKRNAETDYDKTTALDNALLFEFLKRLSRKK